MKKSVRLTRLYKCLTLALSISLITGCSSLSKTKVDPHKSADITIERVDAKTGEIITDTSKNPTTALPESLPQSIISSEPTYSSESGTVQPAYTYQNEGSQSSQETILPEGVVSWESIKTGNSPTGTSSTSTASQNGIPTLETDRDAIEVDAPIILENQTISGEEFTTETQYSYPETQTSVTQTYPSTTSDYSNYVTSSYDIWSRIRSGYSIPSIEHPLIDRYITWNQTHADYVYEMLNRSQPYMYYIVEQIEARGMPMEIALLPAIESAFKVRAYSRSRASGLWQFIPSTGHHFGMRQNWWSDQRRDVIIATNQALDYLLELHEEFQGDWLLAIASYNGGRGTIGKAIRANQHAGLNTDFFSLNLRKETTHYVPKILGLSRVVLNPQAYGIQLPSIPNEPYFEVAQLKGQTDLVQLINNTSISKNQFDALNPQFLRWASDPQGPHRVLVPLADSISVNNYVSSINQTQKINWRKHLIVSGDTLSGIARRYGVNSSAIRTINGMRSNNLRAGKTILIPVRDNQIVADKNTSTLQAARVTQPSQISQPTSIQDTLQVENTINNSVVNDGQSGMPRTHTVKAGDTLWNIARSYNVSIDDLLSINNLQYGSTLSLNQSILLR